MKNYVYFLLPTLIMLTFLSQTTAQNVQWWVTWKVPVYPSRSAEYEAALKKQNELFRKYNWPYTCYTHQTDDYHFFNAVPVKGIDVMPEYDRKWDSLLESMKANNEGNMEVLFKDLCEFSLPFVTFLSPELSWLPPNPRLKPEESVYQRVFFCYVLPGQGTAFEESLAKYVAEFKKKKIDSGFETLVGRMGTEMPFYMWIERYKDPIDMFTTRERIFTELGAEIQKIWQEMQKHIRKMEIKTGWFRPDLSYIPSK